MKSAVSSMQSDRMERGLKAIFAIVLASTLCLTGCQTVRQVQNADETIVETAAPLASTADQKLTINAGAATPVEGKANYYSFPRLTVTSSDSSRLIKSITVQFTSNITVNDEVYLTDSGNFKVFDSTRHGNKSVNNSAGATAEEWQDYLQKNLQIKLADTTTTQSLRMVASFDNVTATYDYNSENGHYYLAVNTSLSWDAAVAAAKTYSYLGMQGYLVTLTSEHETEFVKSLVQADSWLGGTCDKNYMKYEDGTPYEDLPASTFVSGSYAIYYWVTGPEAGQAILKTTLTTPRTREPYKDPDGNDMYYNWREVQPDGAGGREMYIQIYASDGQWNDLPISYPSEIKSYVVEFGGLPSDDDGSASVDADVYVKVDINIDPTGHTITTEAYPTTVGTDPVIKENVNGDEEIKTLSGDDETDAVITRTFYIKDPTADGGWRELKSDELNDNGYPMHAGDYKVESSAVYKEAEGDGDPEMFVPGSATFTIKPATLQMADAEEPLVTKVYDGTDAIDVSAIDISSMLLPGADVDFSASSARFDDCTVAGAKQVIVSDPKLSGTDSGDYLLDFEEDESATEGSATRILIAGAITPRDLVLSLASNVNWGLAGTALKAADGSDPAYKTNLAIHGTGDWAEYELAARDAVNGDVTNTILGQLSFSALSGSTPLDIASPAKGLYGLTAHYANVNPAEGDTLSQKSTVRLMAEGDEEAEAPTAPAPAAGGLDAITAKKLDDGRYDIGNYILTLKGANILITDDPGAEDAYDDATKFISGVVNNEVDEDASPLSPDEILDLIRQIAGADLPEGTPNIQIFKNGEPVDTIDPSELGSYAIVATYPNPDGEDEVVRVGYNVLQSMPYTMSEAVTVPVTEGATPVGKADLQKLVEEMLGDWLPSGVTPSVVITDGDDHQLSEIDLSVPGTYNVTLTYIDENGVAKQVDLTYTVAETQDTVIEGVNIPRDPNGTPITPDDIVKRIEESYPGIVPDGIVPEVTITKNGQTVDSIDPTQPGTYEVTIDYIDPETGEVVKTVKTTYTFVEDPASSGVDGIDDENGSNGNGSEGNGSGSNGTGNPGADGTNGSAGSAGNGSGYTTTSGAKGFDDVATRLLAQTGDPVFWMVCGIVAVAVIAGVVLVVSRRKSRSND